MTLEGEGQHTAVPWDASQPQPFTRVTCKSSLPGLGAVRGTWTTGRRRGQETAPEDPSEASRGLLFVCYFGHQLSVSTG